MVKILSAKVGKETAIIEKKVDKLEVYKPGAAFPNLRVIGMFDILALRDLLNDAYPVSMYRKGGQA